MAGEQILWLAGYAGYVLAVAFGGYKLVSHNLAVLWWILLVLCAVGAVICLLGLEQATGWGGLGWIVALGLGPLPWGVGLLLGGVAGYLRGRKRVPQT